MKLEHVLLALLAQSPRSGYSLKQWLDTEGTFFDLSPHASQIYRSLNRLEEQGLLAHTVSERSGGPDAKIYEVTPAGTEELQRWIASPFQPAVNYGSREFRCRLSFTASMDPQRAVELLKTERDARLAQVRLKRNRDRAVDFTGHHALVDPERTKLMSEEAHRFGTAMLDRWIEWIEHLIEVMTREAELAGQPALVRAGKATA